MMKQIFVSGVVLAACGLSLAKLPPPDDAAKLKAAETAAKAAWQSKVDNYLLCKAQDKVVAYYRKTSTNAAAKGPKAAPVATPPAAVASAKASAPATAASGTPVAAATPGPCSDPGPFAFNPPEQTPLETSGAHSPAGTAASPPSVRQESSQMAPAQKKN
jgi:hypothetical protein